MASYHHDLDSKSFYLACGHGPFATPAQICPTCASTSTNYHTVGGGLVVLSNNQRLSHLNPQPLWPSYPIRGGTDRSLSNERVDGGAAVATHLSDSDHPWNHLEYSVRPDIARICQQNYNGSTARRPARHLTEAGRIRAGEVRRVGACPSCRGSHRRCTHVALERLVPDDLHSGARNPSGPAERLGVNATSISILIPPPTVGISSKQRRSHSSSRNQDQSQQLSSFTLHADSELSEDRRRCFPTEPNWSEVGNVNGSKVQDSNKVTAQKKLDDGYEVYNYQSPQGRAAISVPWPDDARKSQVYVKTDYRHGNFSQGYNTPYNKYISQSVDGTDTSPPYHTTNYNEINQTQNADSDLTRHIKSIFEVRSAMSTQAPVTPAEILYAPDQRFSTNYSSTAIQGGYHTYQQEAIKPPPLDPPRQATTGSNNAVQSTFLRRDQGPSYPWNQLPSTAPQHYALQPYSREAFQQTQLPSSYGSLQQQSISSRPHGLAAFGADLQSESYRTPLGRSFSPHTSAFTPSSIASVHSSSATTPPLADLEAFVATSDFSRLEELVNDVDLDE